MFRFLKDYTLPIAMLLGVLGFPWLRLLAPCLPYLIFLMLFFTFCKVNPLDLRLHRWHWLALAFQLAMSVAVFYLLRPLNLVLAQGVMLCFIMPAATAGPIIAGKLGGSVQSLTSFTMLSNIVTALVVPVFFPVVNPAADMSFWMASLTILRKVTPLLLGPFFAAWLLRLVYDAWQRRRGTGRTFHLSKRWSGLPFYLWALSLVVLMAQITYSLVHDDYDVWVAVAQALGALLACLLQFFVGKKIGERFPSAPHGEDWQEDTVNCQLSTVNCQPKGDHTGIAPTPQKTATDSNCQLSTVNYQFSTRISAGQALGQKNTTLGIWMAQTYLNPVAALGAAAYIIWQNLFNSIQLARAAKGKRV